MHDTPSNCSWSHRGDLYLALGTSYRILSTPKHSGFCPNPWEVRLLHKHSREISASSKEQADDDDQSRNRGRSQSLVSPPTFGRGDEDGFPALSATLLKSALDAKRTQENALNGIHLPPSLSRRSAAVTRAPSLRDLRAAVKMQAAVEEPPQTETLDRPANADKLADLDLDLEKDSQFIRSSGTETSSQQSAYQKLRQVLQGDISTIMRWRATKGYGLSNVSSVTPWSASERQLNHYSWAIIPFLPLKTLCYRKCGCGLTVSACRELKHQTFKAIQTPDRFWNPRNRS